MGFNALARSIEGLHHKVLADCLDDLRGRGLVVREVVSESPRRVRYSLTPAGETLQPVLRAMDRWGEEVVERAETPDQGDVTVP